RISVHWRDWLYAFAHVHVQRRATLGRCCVERKTGRNTGTSIPDRLKAVADYRRETDCKRSFRILWRNGYLSVALLVADLRRSSADRSLSNLPRASEYPLRKRLDRSADVHRESRTKACDRTSLDGGCFLVVGA